MALRIWLITLTWVCNELFKMHTRVAYDEGAAALSEHEGSITFGRLIYLTDTAAEGLAKHKGDIILDGIIELSDKAADSLAAHKWALWLNDLVTLSDAAARSLSGHHGEIAFFGVKNVSFEARELLATEKVFWAPNELTSLTHWEAASCVLWASWQEPLCLNGLRTLTDKAAECLAEHTGPLFLNGIDTLSDTATEALAKHEGELSLNRLTTLSDAVAESLARHKGQIFLNGMLMLSAKASSALMGHGRVATHLDLGQLCRVEEAKGD